MFKKEYSFTTTTMAGWMMSILCSQILSLWMTSRNLKSKWFQKSVKIFHLLHWCYAFKKIEINTNIWTTMVSQVALLVRNLSYQCRRHNRRKFDPWFRKIPWRKAWQPTQIFLPGEFHVQRNLTGYDP